MLCSWFLPLSVSVGVPKFGGSCRRWQDPSFWRGLPCSSTTDIDEQWILMCILDYSYTVKTTGRVYECLLGDRQRDGGGQQNSASCSGHLQGKPSSRAQQNAAGTSELGTRGASNLTLIGTYPPPDPPQRFSMTAAPPRVNLVESL